MEKFSRVFKFNTLSKRYRFIEHVIETEQISALQVIKYLLSFKKLVGIMVVIFGIIGIIAASNSGPKSYSSISLIIPDGGTPPMPNIAGGLQDLLQPKDPVGGGVGIESFPGIMENYPFLLGLLEEEFISEKYGDYVKLGDYIAEIDDSNTLKRAFTKVKNIPYLIVQLLEPRDEPIKSNHLGKKIPVDTLNMVTLNQLSLISSLPKFIKVEGNNSISIETVMPEAKVSTRLNNLVLNKLVEEVTRIKTAKQQRNLILIKNQLDVAKQNFEKSQIVLATFRDANKGSNSAVVESTVERLSSDYSLYFNIYSNLAAEHELAKIELIKNTPFYDIFEPAYVPIIHTGGFKIKVVFIYLIMGMLISILLAGTYTSCLIFILFKSKLEETTIIN